MVLILSEDWQKNRRDHKVAGYPQSREHIRLIEEEGYDLKIFHMEHKYTDENDKGAPAKIKGFTAKLHDRKLVKIGNSWYASDDELGNLLPEEIGNPQQYVEGASKKISVNIYERNAAARSKCIAHYGYKCSVCFFDFEQAYGDIGKNYIHVHHVVPLSKIRKEYELDPIADLIPVCPNCHAIIHRMRPALSAEQLKTHLLENTKRT